MSEQSPTGIRVSALAAMAIFVGSCNGNPTLESLYDEALLTGDWSKVNLREARTRAERAKVKCHRGNGKLYCENRECRCVSSSELRKAMRPTFSDLALRGPPN